jgi:hypothetical protein
MRELLEIVVGLTTGILISGMLVGIAILGTCALAGGGCWYVWKRRAKSRLPDD